MDRETLRAGGLVVCCVVAIAFVAASLSSPVVVDEAGGDGSVIGDEDEIGVGEDPGIFAPGPPEAPPDQEQFGLLPAIAGELCYPIIANPLLLFGLVVSYLGIGAAVSRVFDLGVGVTVIVLCLVLTVIVMLVLLSGCPWQWPEPGQEFAIGEEESVLPEQGSEGEGETAQPIATPTIVLVVLLVATLGGVLAALYLGRSDEEEDEPPPADGLPEPEEPSRIGAVAGRTADELEDDAELENAVYRAWADMTDELPVDEPETTTPGEFATAATDAGMDAGDVGELTDLFESVRYGDAAVTDERERRAIETLRRIEATYTEGDS